ncbi:MAG: ABC transporter substrate-binding protein [Candidatus Latescibacteria bacterium]|nr:ABC transporter substrate-binding protein [Candidatus Latescibacterota bacterium]
MKVHKLLFAGIITILVLCLVPGCSKKTEAPKPPIKIGAIFSVTGPAAKLGGPEKNTVLMIQDQINAAGGINGQMIEVIVEDDQGVEENTINALQKLIHRDNVVAIIGPTRSGNGIAAAPICEEAKVPLVSCAATLVQLYPGKDISKSMYRYVFKTPQNDSHCARTIYADCQKKGFTKVALITGTTAFGAAGRVELQTRASDFGITIVADETYPADATDLTPILTKIKSQNPQALINWSIVAAQGLIAGQMKQIDLNCQLYQSHGFGNPAYITEAAEGVLFPAGRLLVVDDIDSSNKQYSVLKKFKNDYETKFPDEEVSTFAGHGYDALWLVVNAIKANGADRESIRTGLEATKNFVGTAGVFNMSPTDHCGLADDAFAMVTVKGGSFRLVDAVQ